MNKLKIYKNYKLSNLTTFKIGGNSQYYCTPKNIFQIKEAFNYASKNNLRIYIMGGGSNLLISDHGLKGLMINTQKLNKITIKDDIILSECGISIKKLNNFLLKHSLSGLEFSGGLPGSLGGAVFMNARCYGSQFSNVVKSIQVINKKTLEDKTIEFKDLNFSYKNSIFMHDKNLFIYKIKMKFTKGIKKNIKLEYSNNLNDRKSKGQFLFPSAGCIFKNDYDLNLVTGRLIDELDLKGKKIGNAEIYIHHGNFIINTGKAKADDVKKLIEFIENTVYEKKKIKLKREIRLLGFET